jgi:hypothetical protein
LLGYLGELQRAHDVAVLVVHHARKNGSSQAGQSLRGSGDFFAWADSLLYMRRHHGRLQLCVEHRAAPAPEPIALALVGNDVHLQIDVDSQQDTAPNDVAPSLDKLVLEALARAEAPLTRPELRARVRVRNERLGEVLALLAAAGRVCRLGDRWGVPDSHSRPA